jgi:integrase
MSADAGIKLASRNLQSILPLVKEEAHKLGLTFDAHAPGAREALTASLKAYRTARHEVTQRDHGAVIDTPVLRSTTKLPSRTSMGPKSLRDVFDRWKLSGDTPRSKDAVVAMNRALRQFEGQHPTLALTDITRDMGDTYRAWLLVNCNTPKTARDRLTGIKSLLKYGAGTLEWTQRHTWEGLNIKSKTTNRRRPITDTELVTLFTTTLHTRYDLPKAAQGGKDAAYWLPLLGAYTGARLGELCQLRAVDIQTMEGIPVMVLTDDGEGQRIKSEAGKRNVPIHSELLRLGFLEYATAMQSKGVDALWPALPLRKDKASDFFGRWFKDFRQSLELGGPGKPTFHYFRHTVRPLMRRAGFSESTQDKVTGHETQGSVGTVVYDHWTLMEMREAVEAIKYPALSLPKVYRDKIEKTGALTAKHKPATA